jgi:beta-hydroxylase
MRHRDPYAGSLRYHLGLVTPNDDGCWIDVDGQRYSWRDGEDVVFDETYIHQAKNETNVDRIILFCDVERPMRFRWAQAVNRWFATHLVQATAPAASIARSSISTRCGCRARSSRRTTSRSTTR